MQSQELERFFLPFSNYYSLDDTSKTWSRQRETFLKSIPVNLKIQTTESREDITCEKDSSDYLLNCNVYEAEEKINKANGHVRQAIKNN